MKKNQYTAVSIYSVMDFLYNSIETCEKNVIYEITVFFNLITKLYIIMNKPMLQLRIDKGSQGGVLH